MEVSAVFIAVDVRSRLYRVLDNLVDGILPLFRHHVSADLCFSFAVTFKHSKYGLLSSATRPASIRGVTDCARDILSVSTLIGMIGRHVEYLSS